MLQNSQFYTTYSVLTVKSSFCEYHPSKMVLQLNFSNPNLYNPNRSLIGAYVKSTSLRNPCKILSIIRISQ